jgi:FkbM family methyltransferase
MFSIFTKRRKASGLKEFGAEIREFQLPHYGTIQYAQWLNPAESPKILTEDKIKFFQKFVKSGDFAIDIGAHTGDTTLPLALAVGKEGTVLALEPNPIIFKILEKNAQLNPGKVNIMPLCAAAAKYDGEFFYNSSENSFNNGGISEASKSPHGKFALPNKIKGINLGKYLTGELSRLINKLSFIKIDTEGYDYEIILSLLEIIEKYKPVVVAECFKKLSKSNRYRLYDILAEKGYSIYYMSNFNASEKFIHIEKKDMTAWRSFDFCGLPKEKKI